MTRMTIALGALAGAAALASPAFAQSDWSGGYIGASVGYGEARGNSGERVVFDTDGDGDYDDTVRTGAGVDAFSPGFCDGAAIGTTPAAGCKGSDGNLSYGIRAGWDWQSGALVFGGVVEAVNLNIGEDVGAFSTTPASYTFTRDLNYLLSARGRVGYAFDRFLAYGTAGVAWGDIDHNFYTSNTANAFTQSDPDSNAGYQVGGGLEMQWTENMSIGVEYLYTSLPDDEHTVLVTRGTAPATNPFLLGAAGQTVMTRTEEDFDFHAVSITTSWRF